MLLPVLAILAAQPDTSSELAATHAARGEFDRAMALIADARSTDRTALLVRACIALESNQIPEAAKASQALASEAPDTVDAMLLPALVSRRAALPAERWLDSLHAVYEAAGTPDPQMSVVRLPAVEVKRGPTADQLRIIRGTADAFLVRAGLAPAIDATLIRSAFAELTRRDVAPAAWWVAATILTADEVPKSQRRVARVSARRLIERASDANPEDGFAALAVVLLGRSADEALTAEELAAAEAALRRRTFRLPLPEVFDGVRGAWRKIDSPQADARGFAASARYFLPEVHLALLRRVHTGIDVDPRNAALLEAVGKRLEANRTMLDRSVGSALMVAAADLNVAGTSRAATRDARIALMRLWTMADEMRPLRWPIPSMLRERWQREVVDGFDFRRALVIPGTDVTFTLTLAPPAGTRVEAKVLTLKGQTIWSSTRTGRDDQLWLVGKTASDREQVLDVWQRFPDGRNCRARALLKPEQMYGFPFLGIDRQGDQCTVITKSFPLDLRDLPRTGDFPPYAPPLLNSPPRINAPPRHDDW